MDIAGQIDRLWAQHKEGILTRAEFDLAKTIVLSAAGQACNPTVSVEAPVSATRPYPMISIISFSSFNKNFPHQ